MHRHEYDYVVVPATGGTLTVLDSAGIGAELRQVAGEAYARNAGIEHEVISVGNRVMIFV
jgi:hypothetical protein